MRSILMIADDLTGACDAGIQFADGGIRSVVLFDPSHFPNHKTDAVVLDTASRAMAPDKAYEAVSQQMAHMKAASFDLVYKKMDSTLRGNIGTELDAIMDQLKLEQAVVAPALPALNRVTKQGVHYWNGVKIADTEMGRDPKTPVTESDLIKLLSGQSRRKAGLIDLAVVRGSKEAFRAHVFRLMEEGCGLFVCDAETPGDLAQITDGFSDWAAPLLWAGSAGLAEQLVPNQEVKTKPDEVLKPEGPVLLVCGSRSALTKTQVQQVKQKCGAVETDLQPDQLLHPAERKKEIVRCVDELKQIITSGQDAILAVGETVKAERHLPERIEATIGQVAAQVIRACGLKRVILTGGDTAKAVALQMGAEGMDLIREIEPGIPLARMLGLPQLTAVTKAGAFGGPHSLCQAVAILKG